MSQHDDLLRDIDQWFTRDKMPTNGQRDILFWREGADLLIRCRTALSTAQPEWAKDRALYEQFLAVGFDVARLERELAEARGEIEALKHDLGRTMNRELAMLNPNTTGVAQMIPTQHKTITIGGNK